MAFRRLCVYGPTPAVSSRRGIELTRVDTRARVRAIQGKIYMARFSSLLSRFVVPRPADDGSPPISAKAKYKKAPSSIPGKRKKVTKEREKEIPCHAYRKYRVDSSG